MSWQLKHFTELTNDELYRILQARVAVFVIEQTCFYPEIDGSDAAAWHLFKEIDGQIAAYLRLFPRGVKYEQASLGRVLVAKEFRGQGLAQALLQRGMDFLRGELGERAVKIQAQAHLDKFYGQFGFTAISAVYPEDGIPHQDMLWQAE